VISIDAALSDGNLLGAALGPATTWRTWLVVLRAAFGAELSFAPVLRRRDCDCIGPILDRDEGGGGRKLGDPMRERSDEIADRIGRQRSIRIISSRIDRLIRKSRKGASYQIGIVYTSRQRLS
jgi:hypothetical protein